MNTNLKHILHDIPDTNLSVTDNGKLIKSNTGEEITSEVIRYKDKTIRVKTLILTIYKALDLQELYPTVTDVWYEFFNEETYSNYIDYSLVDFCKEQEINYKHARNCLYRGVTTKDGWSIKRKTN
ncbi:hypothetical protein ACAS46_002742 [Vibrio vulnificus]